MYVGFAYLIPLQHIQFSSLNFEDVVLKNEYIFRYTVKLVYKDHPRDQQNIVLIHRWSLYTGSITWTVYTWGLLTCGLYKQVVFRAGLPVFINNVNFNISIYVSKIKVQPRTIQLARSQALLYTLNVYGSSFVLIVCLFCLLMKEWTVSFGRICANEELWVILQKIQIA